ncbi:hypothetical protein B0H14DRAFT_2619659 [Mycena olivaceomarginata]|nr:hypothetical protein B0H14DRAFT_2619659 [Mycena olivaceomarginata]
MLDAAATIADTLVCSVASLRLHVLSLLYAVWTQTAVDVPAISQTRHCDSPGIHYARNSGRIGPDGDDLAHCGSEILDNLDNQPLALVGTMTPPHIPHPTHPPTSTPPAVAPRGSHASGSNQDAAGG